jgi:hypothetical protein
VSTSVAQNSDLLAPKTRRRKARKSHLLVMLGSLAAGSAATVTVLDSWDKVLVNLGLMKSEAFVLAQNNAQGELLRQLTRLISQRVFWVERYAGEVATGFPKEDQDDSWKRYNDSLIAWNENYMLNVRLTEKYFGVPSKDKLADLNWLLRQLNTCLNRIRYRTLYHEKDQACHFSGIAGGTEAENIHALNEAMKEVYGMVDEFTMLVAK